MPLHTPVPSQDKRIPKAESQRQVMNQSLPHLVLAADSLTCDHDHLERTEKTYPRISMQIYHCRILFLLHPIGNHAKYTLFLVQWKIIARPQTVS